MAAQFYYGVNFEITASNVVQLYCVSHYLEMIEDYSKGNLCSLAEEYLESNVCKNLEPCVEILRLCENLLPLADDLRIVPHCIDAIALKACVEHITSSFSRLEYSSSSRLHMSKQNKSEGDWWTEDLSILRINLYQRVIVAMKYRGVRPESIGTSLVSYAEKELLKKSRPKVDWFSSESDHERVVVETIISLLVLHIKKFAVPLHFLFWLLLLRNTVFLECTVSCRLELERRVGSQLDTATLDDVLIPSFRNDGDTLFDVDTFQRILINFSQQDEMRAKKIWMMALCLNPIALQLLLPLLNLYCSKSPN